MVELLAAVAVPVVLALSEQEQLELLNRADEYHGSPGWEWERAIELYEEVLREVDLSRANEIDILWKVGRMYLFDRKSPPTKRDWERGRDVFAAVAEKGAWEDRRTPQAKVYVANAHHHFGEVARADEWYLDAWTHAVSVANEKGDSVGSWEQTWITSLISMHLGNGQAGAKRIEELKKRFRSDELFLEAVDETVAWSKKVQAGRGAEAFRPDDNSARPRGAAAGESASPRKEESPARRPLEASPPSPESGPIDPGSHEAAGDAGPPPEQNGFPSMAIGGAAAIGVLIAFGVMARNRRKGV